MKSRNLKSGLLIALLLALLATGLNALAEATDGGASPSEVAAQVQEMARRLEALEAERALDIALNRCELENLQLVDGPIYVTGHKTPDTDTVCSAILYAKLLSALGYDARPRVLGPVNNETKFILEQAGAEVPETLVDASGLNLVLVDHSETIQSAEGIEDANIVSIIDHHSDGSVTTGSPLIYDARPIGSTATIIWLRYRSYGVEVDAQSAALIIGAILSDTSGLKNAMTSLADREAVTRLSPLAGIEDVNAVYTEIYKHSISYEGMTDQEIFDSDVRDYECGDYRYCIATMSVYDEDGARDLSGRMAAIISDMAAAHGADLAYAHVSIYHDDISVNYLVASDEAAAEVLQEAFPDKLEFDGTAYILRPGVSRRHGLVPALTEVLENHPKE
ncbi:MAG: DHH family phosphoesterase [Clostridia bacterium]|nr:DHH family phosphoesterase [Clostridia bacterium]